MNFREIERTPKMNISITQCGLVNITSKEVIRLEIRIVNGYFSLDHFYFRVGRRVHHTVM